MHEAQHHDALRFRKAATVTLIGLAANIFHCILKIAVGFATRYSALIASGIHSLSDSVSDLLAMVALKVGSRRADHRFHFGYRRVETLGSLVCAGLLVYAAIEVILHAFHEEQHEDPAGAGLAVVAVSLLVILSKEYLFRYTKRKGIELSSPMLIAKAWHHRTDAASCGAVLISVLVSYLLPQLELVDAVTTVIVSGFILHAAWEVGKDAVRELIDSGPTLRVVALVEEMAEHVGEVTFTHDIRIRTMGGALIIELTAEVDPGTTVEEGSRIAEKIRQEISEHVENVLEVRLQITPKGEYVRKHYPELIS